MALPVFRPSSIKRKEEKYTLLMADVLVALGRGESVRPLSMWLHLYTGKGTFACVCVCAHVCVHMCVCLTSTRDKPWPRSTATCEMTTRT